MKILRLYYRLPPLPGGMENHIAQLTKEQIKLGHDVSIYFNQGSCVTANDIQISKIPLFKIKPLFIGHLIFIQAILQVFLLLMMFKKNWDCTTLILSYQQIMIFFSG